jgi:transcriptional regulator with XRE-family HTH domain
VAALLERDRRSTWDLANDSGLSPSTIRNWERGKVRNPQSVSLQMAARSLGKRLVLK